MTQQDTEETRSTRIWPWVLASILALLVIPAGIILVILSMDVSAHEAAFQGVCGPYAPDIEAYPCDLETYMDNYPPPFAAIAYLMQWFGYTVAVLLAETVLWGIWFVRRILRRRAAAR